MALAIAVLLGLTLPAHRPSTAPATRTVTHTHIPAGDPASRDEEPFSEIETSKGIVASVEALGTLENPTGVQRDGGASALVGDQILWVFGDTLFPVTAVDGARYRSNTAALSSPGNPPELREQLDAHGSPYQLIPFAPTEEAYNRRSGDPEERIAIWPGRIIPDGSAGAFVFFYKLRVHPGRLNLEMLGTGVAYVRAGQTVAIRYPGLLFRSPEPPFAGGTVVGPYLYAYGCSRTRALTVGCEVARVLKSELASRGAYRFWDGARWVRTIKEAKPVLTGEMAGFSISWNAYLHKYIAVYSELFTNRVLMKTADRPEGPWSGQPVFLFSGLTPVGPDAYDYAGREHVELSQDGGKVILVTYTHPLGALRAEICLVRVELHRPPRSAAAS